MQCSSLAGMPQCPAVHTIVKLIVKLELAIMPAKVGIHMTGQQQGYCNRQKNALLIVYICNMHLIFAYKDL